MTGREHDVFDLLEPLDERSGPATRISAQRAAAMVRAAVERAAIAEPAARPPRRRSVALVAAAVMVLGGAAVAAIYRAAAGGDEPTPAEAVERPAPAPEIAAAPDAAPVQALPVVEPLVEPEPEPEPEPESRTASRESPPRRGPEDLLAAANQSRGRRQWSEAAGLYERVRREHAETTAAYVATVASADLHLHHLDEPKRALALYRAALRARPDGTLAAEALLGIAESHRELGDAGAERTALERLVERYPDSLLRERADERLRALAGPPR